MLNAPGLAGWEPAKAPLQQPQYQGDAFFATTFLMAFLLAFGEHFLIEAAFLEIGVGESEHGLNLLSGQLGQTIDQV